MATAETDPTSRTSEGPGSSRAIEQLDNASYFRYQQLDASRREIRLLELMPRGKGYEESLIKCSIKRACLDQPPPYTALSYTWEDISDKVTIILDHHSFHISRSLLIALEHLQEDKMITLWIDAICINQEDNSEKSSQVALMRNIYEEAVETVVWLGPAENDSDLAMDKLIAVGGKALSCGIMDLCDRPWDLEKWVPIAYGKRRCADEGPLERLVRTSALGTTSSATFPAYAINNLLHRRWGSRSWVMQELAVSRRPVFVCGTKRLPADEMNAAIGLYECLNTALKGAQYGKWAKEFTVDIASANVPTTGVHNPLGNMLQIRKDYFGNTSTEKQPFDLDRLLLMGAHNLHASDPRDKVYAFLGLIRDSEVSGIQPDYSKTCPEVYISVAKCLLEGEFGTNMLSICTHKNGVPGLPSWTPDWSLPIEIVNLQMGFQAGMKLKKSLFFQHIDGRDILTISGSPFDKITAFGPKYDLEKGNPLSWKEQWAHDSEWIRAVGKSLAGYASAYRTPEDLEDAIWRSLIFDQDISLDTGYTRTVRASDASRLSYRLLSLPWEKVCDDEVFSSMFLTAIKIVNQGRRPFVTSKGYIGLGPDTTSRGDEVVIVAGAVVPYLLHQGPDDCYRLLGDAFVHGIMDGEGLHWQSQMTFFSLC